MGKDCPEGEGDLLSQAALPAPAVMPPADGGAWWPPCPGRTQEPAEVSVSSVTVSSFPKRICYPSTTATNCSSPVMPRAASYDFNYC